MPLDPDVTRAAQDALRRYKADIFSVLANPTRIHLIECLKEGEHSVGALVERLKVEPANASQHLAVLRAKALVNTRKEGNQVFYSLRDKELTEVLDSMKRLFHNHLEDTQTMLATMREENARI